LNVTATLNHEIDDLFLLKQVAGSFWYLLTVQRVETCLDLQSVRIADSPSTTFACPIPISFGHQPDDLMRMTWSQNTSVQGCLKGDADNFQYGIYLWAVPLVTDGRFVQKILYPLFWGVMTIRCHSLTNSSSSSRDYRRLPILSIFISN
jgi:cyclic nucleotide gated channel